MRKDGKKSGFRKFLTRTVIALAVLAVLPVIEVGCTRAVNPPISPEMMRFLLTSRNAKARKHGLLYEWMPLEEIPKDLVRFIWASEDQRFFEHNGIDWKEIDLALAEAEKSGDKPRGASTITMQCARSVFLWQGRSWVRKALEAYYAVLMEALLPKERILELYLNEIEFGEGVYGVNAAAREYYGVPPARLNPYQMAMLAAILPNPKEWDPRRPTPRVLQRQQRVLRLARNANFPAGKLGAGAKR